MYLNDEIAARSAANMSIQPCGLIISVAQCGVSFSNSHVVSDMSIVAGM